MVLVLSLIMVRLCIGLETAAEKNSEEAMFQLVRLGLIGGEHGNAIAYIWLFLSAHFGYSEANS